MAALIAKARSKLYAVQDILQSEAPIQRKLWLLDRVVWPSISWSVGVIHPTQSSISMLNTFQAHCIILCVKCRRRPEETYFHFKQRTTRLARLLIHQNGRERWGTRFIRLNWSYAGHRARDCFSSNPSVAGIVMQIRPYCWWVMQKDSVIGIKHSRRHFPRISNEDRDRTRIACIDSTCQDWRSMAVDKARWKSHEGDWVKLLDIPWSSGRQLALIPE